MKDSKLVSILKTFSKEEFKEFEKFIDSPFFSTGRNLKPLYRALRKFYPSFDSQDFTKENVFRALMPAKQYNNALLRRHVSDMSKMAEEYIKQVVLREEPFEVRKAFLYELMARKNDALFLHHLKLLEKYIDSQKLHNSYFNIKAEYEAILIEYYLTIDHQESVTGNVVSRGNYHILQFLVSLSIDLSDLIVNNHAFNSSLNNTLAFRIAESTDFKLLLENIRDSNPEYYQIAELFCCNILSVIQPANEEYVKKQKELIETVINIDLFSKEFQRTVLVDLIGRLMERYLTGKPEYQKLMFEVNKILLEKKLFRIENCYFPIIAFKSLIQNALQINEIEWTEKFIEEFHKQLAPECRNSMKHYGYAFLFFKKKEYKRSFEECSKVKFENIIINYDIKLLTLKLYYDTDSFETALSFIDSFKHFVSSNKFISEPHKEYFNNLIYFVNKLIKAQMGNERIRKDDLIGELSRVKNVHGRDWVLEKAMELK